MTGLRKWWADRAWKAGDRLDRMGRRLLVEARLPAALLAACFVIEAAHVQTAVSVLVPASSRP